ncbi:hypothetical protein MBLNU230_g1967t1 [Neophaeotheca triangularis]
MPGLKQLLKWPRKNAADSSAKPDPDVMSPLQRLNVRYREAERHRHANLVQSLSPASEEARFNFDFRWVPQSARDPLHSSSQMSYFSPDDVGIDVALRQEGQMLRDDDRLIDALRSRDERDRLVTPNAAWSRAIPVSERVGPNSSLERLERTLLERPTKKPSPDHIHPEIPKTQEPVRRQRVHFPGASSTGTDQSALQTWADAGTKVAEEKDASTMRSSSQRSGDERPKNLHTAIENVGPIEATDSPYLSKLSGEGSFDNRRILARAPVERVESSNRGPPSNTRALDTPSAHVPGAWVDTPRNSLLFEPDAIPIMRKPIATKHGARRNRLSWESWEDFEDTDQPVTVSGGAWLSYTSGLSDVPNKNATENGAADHEERAEASSSPSNGKGKERLTEWDDLFDGFFRSRESTIPPLDNYKLVLEPDTVKSPEQLVPRADMVPEVSHSQHLNLAVPSSNLQRSPSTQRQILSDENLARQLSVEAEAEAEATPREHDCTICSDTLPPLSFPAKPPTATCTHDTDTCTDCLKTWLASEITSKPPGASIKCPVCAEQLSHSEIQTAAPADAFAVYDARVARAALNGIQDFAWCLRPGCGSGQFNLPTTATTSTSSSSHNNKPTNNSTTSLLARTLNRNRPSKPSPQASTAASSPFMQCTHCNYRQCLSCLVPWHDEESCATYQYRTSGAQKRDEEAKTAAMLDNVSKVCPGPGKGGKKSCGVRIQKGGGCDHMRCRTCLHEFCWQCLASHAEIKRVGNTAHARDCKFHSQNLDIAWPFNVHGVVAPHQPPAVRAAARGEIGIAR